MELKDILLYSALGIGILAFLFSMSGDDAITYLNETTINYYSGNGTSIETDPIFTASWAFNIALINTTQWNSHVSGGNSTQEIIDAVNNTGLNLSSAVSYPCSQIVFDNGIGSATICDGLDSSGGTTNNYYYYSTLEGDKIWIYNDSTTLYFNETRLHLMLSSYRNYSDNTGLPEYNNGTMMNADNTSIWDAINNRVINGTISGGSQTPWESDIDANYYTLNNLESLNQVYNNSNEDFIHTISTNLNAVDGSNSFNYYADLIEGTNYGFYCYYASNGIECAKYNWYFDEYGYYSTENFTNEMNLDVNNALYTIGGSDICTADNGMCPDIDTFNSSEDMTSVFSPILSTYLNESRFILSNTSIDTRLDNLETGSAAGGGNSTQEIKYAISSANYFTPIVNDFLVGGTTDPLSFAAISSGTTGMANPDANTPGIIYFLDSTTANGGYRAMTGTTAFLIAGGEYARFIFSEITTKTTAQYRLGFQDSTSVTVPTDGCYFSGRNNLVNGTCRSNNAETSTSEFAIVDSVYYDMHMFINSAANSVNFTIYNSTSGVALFSELVTTNIPTDAARVTGFGIIATESTTNAAANLIAIDFASLTINRTLTRGKTPLT